MKLTEWGPKSNDKCPHKRLKRGRREGHVKMQAGASARKGSPASLWRGRPHGCLQFRPLWPLER